MALTLKELVQETCARTGVKRPSVVATATDSQTIQWLGLLHETLEELAIETRPLSFLLKEFTYPLLGQEDQGSLETVCGEPVRYILNDILWNRTLRLPVFGPLGASRWQEYKAYGITGPTSEYRIRGDRLLMIPSPTAGHTLAGEFVRRRMVVATGGTVPTKERFTVDTDFSIVPDELLIASLRWRWKREKGLPYAEDKNRYNGMLAGCVLRDGTKRTMSLEGHNDHTYVKPAIVVPNGSWNP